MTRVDQIEEERDRRCGALGLVAARELNWEHSDTVRELRGKSSWNRSSWRLGHSRGGSAKSTWSAGQPPGSTAGSLRERQICRSRRARALTRGYLCGVSSYSLYGAIQQNAQKHMSMHIPKYFKLRFFGLEFFFIGKQWSLLAARTDKKCGWIKISHQKV